MAWIVSHSGRMKTNLHIQSHVSPRLQMQASDFCGRSLLHYTQPCRTGPSGTNATALPPPPAVFPCTPPHAEAILSIAGNLTQYTATIPAAGFECDCICDTAALGRLGTIGVAMRATDGGPNFQALESECAAGLRLQVIDGILQRPCASSIRAGVQVRRACLCGSWNHSWVRR
eukprot:jgi/Ulvmu1/10121/UM006_0073.1